MIREPQEGIACQHAEYEDHAIIDYLVYLSSNRHSILKLLVHRRICEACELLGHGEHAVEAACAVAKDFGGIDLLLGGFRRGDHNL